MSIPAGETFHCAVCGGCFVKGRGDEEAVAEMQATWQPHEGDDDLDLVCDPCFKRFMEWAKTNLPEFLR